MAETTDIFALIADPTRRRVLDLVAERGPLSVGEIAAEFPELVSSGISKHLMALRAANIVSAEKRGRHQLYSLNGEKLSEALSPWLAKYQPYWVGALDRLKQVTESGHA